MNSSPLNPSVSVVVTGAGGVRALGLTLDSLATQVDAPPFEVVLSVRGRREKVFAESWRGRLSIIFAGPLERRGRAFAGNVGMSHGVAEKFLFCCTGDAPAPDWVAQGSAALDEADAFSGVTSGGTRETRSTVVRCNHESAERGGDDRGSSAGRPVPDQRPSLDFRNFGIRRAAALAVGGFDASFMGLADEDLAIRLRRHGASIASVEAAQVVRRCSDRTWEAFRQAWVAAVWQVALGVRHGSVERSAPVPGKRWYPNMPSDGKREGSGRAWGSGTRELRRLDLRLPARTIGSAVGLRWGRWRFGVMHLVPPIRTGVGLGPGEGAHRQPTPDWLLGHPVLIVSPHLDDALLSASEIVRRVEPEVWNVLAGEPDDPVTTDWDRRAGFADSHAQMVARRREDAAAFEETGVNVRQFDGLEEVYTTPERQERDLLELRWELIAWVDGHSGEGRRPVVVAPAGAGLPIPPGVPAAAAVGVEAPAHGGGRIKDRLRAIKRRTGLEVPWRYVPPLMLSANGDHLAVRDTVLETLVDDDRVTVLLAEDPPYSWWESADREISGLCTRLPVTALPMTFEADVAWQFDRIRHYSSQVRLLDVPDNRTMGAETLPRLQRYWRLQRDPL